MGDSITSDRAMRTAQAALDGLAVAQEMIGHNLANVDTPGYRAQSVDFQTSLRRALGKEAGISLQTTNSGHQVSLQRPDRVLISERPGGSTRADGNNVDIDVELSQMAETGISYQAISQLVSKKLVLMKYIASGR
jgi:flagellar basal-body rod protein FlgB